MAKRNTKEEINSERYSQGFSPICRLLWQAEWVRIHGVHRLWIYIPECALLVLIEGLFFILLTVTGLRKKIFDALPDAVKLAIPAGIGLFIALLGLQNAGIAAPDEATCVDLASFNLLTQNWGSIMPWLSPFVPSWPSSS